MDNFKSPLAVSLAAPALALFLLLPKPQAWAATPRSPLPPWPEVVLGKWSFDEPLFFAQPNAGQAVSMDSTIWVPSWSGYALNRQGASVQPLILLMATTNRWNVAPDQGAIRFWFSPAFSSSGTGLGQGPGHHARLLEMSMAGGKDSVVLWSLYVSADGNTLYLSGEGDNGPVDFLKTDIQWQSGEWHLICLSYGALSSLNSPLPFPARLVAQPDESRGTFLHLDGQAVAMGEALPVVPQMLAAAAKLTVGSTADGQEPASGAFEELTTFDYPLLVWQWYNYYEANRNTAALGPVTPEEQAALRAAVLARQAALAANPALASTSSMIDLSGGVGLMGFDYTNGFWFGTTTNDGTNFIFTLANADTNKSYDIYFVPALTSNTIFSNIVLHGLQAQTNFILQMIGAAGFFRGSESGDWDRDGVLNWADPQPYNAAVSNLVITIDTPTNNSTIP